MVAGTLGAQTPGDTAVPRHNPATWVGPYAGAAFTTLFGRFINDEYHTRLDFSGGMQWDQFFDDAAFFRSGVFYTGRGAGYTSTGGVDLAFTERYIEFPLLLGYRFPNDVPTRVFVMGGAQVGFQFGCKVNEDVHCTDQGNEFRTVDLALVAGAGLFLPVGRARLALELRLMQGLRSIEEYNDLKNRGLTIGGAYMRPLR
jgi:hypothetical protein